MKRTIKLFRPERFVYADGTVETRDEVTVTNYATTLDQGRERTVWAEVDDNSMLYTLEHGRLWRFDGDVYRYN